MSEIFRSLKKTELHRSHAPANPADASAEISAAPELVEAFPEMAEGHPVDLPLEKVLNRSDAKFDLAAADQRIRNVLDPMTIVGEHYRLLRTKLSQLQKQKGIKTLLVTSSVPMEGKTFTACCLAGVFAQEPGRRVLLIDADMRKPRTGYQLGMKGFDHPGGLSQVLRGEKSYEEVLLSSGKMDFFLLPAGPVPEDPADLLTSPRLEATIKSLSQLFDWVVIDSPPALALTDATLLVPLCDATLLVVRAGKTPARIVKEAVQKIGREKICGVVLNRSRRTKSSNYYYYSYYRKGSKRNK